MAIYIPEEQYVGFQLRKEGGAYDSSTGTWVGVEEVLLGFATPVSADAAFKKRKATVDHWGSGYHYADRNNDQPDERCIPRTLKNELVEGFEIARSVRRYGWNGGNVVWRVIDPRGFELEISSANFASIVDCTTIVNGVIQGRCVWGRDGSTNVLLPENSEPYQEFVKLTALKNQVKAGGVSVKDIKPGYIITLESGDEVEYLGKFYCYKLTYETTKADKWHDSYTDHSLFDTVVERFMYKIKHGGDAKIQHASRLKIAKVNDSSNVTTLTDNERVIKTIGTEFIHVTSKKPTAPIIVDLEPVSLNTVLDRASCAARGYDVTYIGTSGASHVYLTTHSYHGYGKIGNISLTKRGYDVHRDRHITYALTSFTSKSAEPTDPNTLANYEWHKLVIRFEDGSTYEPKQYYYGR